MRDERLQAYLDQMRVAATDALTFVDGMSKDEFLIDLRTQRAVVMSLIIVGEAAARAMDRFSTFCLQNPQVPWQDMRGMRNRMAHGYFDLNLDVVWETVQTALPNLLEALSDLPHDADP
jgi:uncharacterized protein with HEPN domain